MGYAERTPPHALRSLVSCTWAMSDASAPHRVLPDGCIDILLMPDGRARVVGTMESAIVVPPSGPCLGIRFLPGEAARLLPEAPRELTDSDARLTDLWGDEGRRLEDALGASGTDLLAAEPIVERLLTARLAKHAAAADLQVRVGTAPKVFARVMRLLRARDLLGERDLADVAALAGYADQAHFTREAVALAGVTPARLAREMSDSFNPALA